MSEDEDCCDEDVAGRGTVAKRIDILTPKVRRSADVALSCPLGGGTRDAGTGRCQRSTSV